MRRRKTARSISREPLPELLGQRATFPALRQEVHTLRRLGAPLTVARTRWIFGFQRRLVFFFDQGTL